MNSIRSSFFILVFACVSLTTFAQSLKWPVITSLNKPWSRWWWEGSAVTKEGLTAAMQKYAKAGLGGLEVTPIYGVKGYEKDFIPFLTPKWMEMLDFTLGEAKKLHLGIDMATGTGWPFGGPWVTPENACKNVNLKTYSLKAGEKIPGEISFHQEPIVRTANGKTVLITQLSYPVSTNKDLQSLALDQVRYDKQLVPFLLMAYSDKGDTINLTTKLNAKHELDWTAPQGNWNVYALFQGWHGKMVERAAPGGEGDAIDHFSAKALTTYLGHFDQAFKGHQTSQLRSFFNDSYEVDDARGQANWTPEFLKDFKTRRGYDLQNHLPALFQKDSPEKNSRILYDYRLTVSELLLDNFTVPWHSWARAKGALVRNQSHGSPSNILDLYAAIDIPETEGTDILRFKFATSAAHVNGKPLASSESATWLNEHFQSSLGDVKTALDKYFVGGVNHIFYHGTNYSPENDPWPGWLFYAAVHFTPANPFWRDFDALNKYVARTQSFLQKGNSDNDLLVYFPINDRFSVPGNAMLQHFDGMEGFEKTNFNTSAEYLLEHGYAFDFISDKQVGNLQNAGISLKTGNVNYQSILFADTKFTTPDLLGKLVALAKNGATILFYNNFPSEVPGFGDLAAKNKKIAEIISTIKFEASKDKTVTQAKIGKGSFLKGSDLSLLLQFAKIRREEIMEKEMLFVRRKTKEGSLYFITNSGKSGYEGWMPLSSAFVSAGLYDPMKETSGMAKTRKGSNGGREVFLQLPAGESMLIQAYATVVKASLFPYFHMTGNPVAVNGPWEIRFLEGGPTLPAPEKVPAPVSWTDLDKDAMKIFSGTGEYTVVLPRPQAGAAAWLLDLGKVSESAEVILNDKSLGKLLGPTYQLIIPAKLFKESNTLRIKVTNSMANRIIDLEKRGVEWKKFYNTNFPSRLAANRDAHGIFTAKSWSPKPSGLLGPVVMTAVEFEKE